MADGRFARLSDLDPLEERLRELETTQAGILAREKMRGLAPYANGNGNGTDERKDWFKLAGLALQAIILLIGLVGVSKLADVAKTQATVVSTLNRWQEVPQSDVRGDATR